MEVCTSSPLAKLNVVTVYAILTEASLLAASASYGKTKYHNIKAFSNKTVSRYMIIIIIKRPFYILHV